MAFRQTEIQKYSDSITVRKTLKDAKLENKPTAFLSHSHKDAHLAKGVQGFLHSQGWEVYIDWEDSAMPAVPNRATAVRIQTKITELDMFLYLATVNSSSSRWCPWELGYADGKKKLESILILQTSDTSGVTYGNEYLQLYRHLDFAEGGGIGSFGSDNRGRVLKGAVRAFD
jgi:TIR domain